MKRLIRVLAFVFAFGVTMPAFAADPAHAAPAEKKDDGKTKKDMKKDGKKEEKK